MLNLKNKDKIHARPNPTCYLCGSIGELSYTGLKDRIFNVPGEWSLKKCSNSNCRLVWLDPEPIEEDIPKLYKDYYTHAEKLELSKAQQNKDLAHYLYVSFQYVKTWLVWVSTLKYQRDQVGTMYLADVKPGKLLEIGCGSGKFLRRMQGFGWSVEGIDFDAKAVEQARLECNFTVHVGTLESIKYQANNFDVVAMNHVIEHVPDPVSLLQECHRILRPGGRLVVITPNIDSWGHQEFKQNWRGLEPPRHLYLFSQNTLSSCASKAGFNTFKAWTTSANAEVFFLGSLDIKETGAHKMGVRESKNLKIPLQSFILQYYTLLKKWANPGLGEEVVLVCEK